MKKLLLSALIFGTLFSCGNAEKDAKDQEKNNKESNESNQSDAKDFQYKADKFADIQVLNYRIPGFDKFSLQQKKLAYYLYQAGLSGRDIIYDQNYKHNLAIRNALESIVTNYKGEKDTNWDQFIVYTKRVWFSNGIHHHYSMDKFLPEFDRAWFESALKESGASLEAAVIDKMFDPNVDMKRVNLNPEKGLIKGSANNFYGEGITEKMVDDYYAKRIDKSDTTPISYGLNSKLVLNENGELEEKVWHIDGMYGDAIEKIVFWLEKAVEVAENDAQAKALKLLIEYYKTGDLKTWDAYNIAWVNATEGDIDYINGFIEVYGDAKGYRATYESVVQMKNFEASERMKVLQENTQWFEDNSSIMAEHKKKNVKGVTYKVINVIGESGDASPSTPIGINLPNANWIRANHGSKSVSLGNIVEAYNEASGGSLTKEFAHDEEEIARAEKYGMLGSKLHTALHEVVGHASGKLNPGVGTPKETLKNYASTLEEGRADLVALYFLLDPKMVELGLMESLEVGKAEYDSYIRNGLMAQLQRLEPGADIEEAHMRNRQLVASWVFEKGQKDNVIEKVTRDGKTYYEIHDYEKLRGLFGDLLREIQRIKSEGDYKAGRDLVENYGVKVDQSIHEEVLARVKPLNISPYKGFINPTLVPVEEDGEIIDVKIEYPASFQEQMLNYSKQYGFLK